MGFWRSRQLLLGDVLDEGGAASQPAIGDSALRLSRREAQLLAFFTRNPQTRFAANALAIIVPGRPQSGQQIRTAAAFRSASSRLKTLPPRPPAL